MAARRAGEPGKGVKSDPGRRTVIAHDVIVGLHEDDPVSADPPI
jgi:hypothetical protein